MMSQQLDLRLRLGLAMNQKLQLRLKLGIKKLMLKLGLKKLGLVMNQYRKLRLKLGLKKLRLKLGLMKHLHRRMKNHLKRELKLRLLLLGQLNVLRNVW